MSLEGFFATLDRCILAVRDFFGITPTSLCPLHTCDELGDEQGGAQGGGKAGDGFGILVADNAAMVTLVELEGSLRLVGPEEYEAVCEGLSQTLATPLSREGHALQMVFSCDPEEGRERVRRALAPHRTSAKNLDLALLKVLDDWEGTLGRYCASEQAFLALWTKPSILTRAELKKALRENLDEPVPFVRTREAQTGRAIVGRMRDVHKAFVRNVCERLTSAGLRLVPLDAHAAVSATRRCNVPELTGKCWRPLLPGDRLPLREKERGSAEHDLTHVLYPTIARQIWPCGARVVAGRYVEVCDRLYAPLALTLPPQTILPFASLFRSLLAENLPWRASFLLSGDGMRGTALKSAAASILSFASPTNRMLQQSYRALGELALQGGCAVGFQLCLATWVRVYDHADLASARAALARQAARLASAVQAWGACDTSFLCGDPLALYCATLPACAPNQPSPKAIAPLDEAVRLMPLFRPTSPWEGKGCDVPLRTPDGKLMPMGLFHSLQASWNEICFAGMGSGKSFFLNTLNFFFVLRPGQTRLPWLTVIDIGPSCAGVIELVRQSLPKEKRHLAVFARLRNVREAAINPFDTPLGCERPLPSHASFLINLLALLCTPLSETAPADGVMDLLREALDAVYRRMGPTGPGPRRFDPYPEPLVTAWMREQGVKYDRTTTWWEIVRELFEEGEIPLAIRAQRHAVPQLTDFLAELNDPLIRDRFASLRLPGSAESVPEACVRHLTTALREYPILSAPTRFGLGEAQIVGLDLSEVTPRGGPAAERQSGIMYMLARHVGAGHFFTTTADIDRIPARYRSWHRPRLEALAADPKRLCYDEFHRASCQDMLNPLSRQILADLTTASREARKQNLSICLYSQQLGDFPEVLVELATSIYVLGAGTARETDEIARCFGLNEAARYALRNITRPTSAGADLVALFRTSLGTSIQHLTCTAGSFAKWAFTTTAEDMRVRNRLYETLGVSRALECLTRYYPGGSIKEEAERRRLAMENTGSAPEDVVEHIARDLKERAREDARRNRQE